MITSHLHDHMHVHVCTVLILLLTCQHCILPHTAVKLCHIVSYHILESNCVTLYLTTYCGQTVSHCILPHTAVKLCHIASYHILRSKDVQFCSFKGESHRIRAKITCLSTPITSLLMAIHCVLSLYGSLLGLHCGAVRDRIASLPVLYITPQCINLTHSTSTNALLYIHGF